MRFRIHQRKWLSLLSRHVEPYGCCTVSRLTRIHTELCLTSRPSGQDNLHSGPESPVSLAAGDITALLPCSEEDFAKGQEPPSRAALEDTPPAIDNPKLISDPRRSLFATLIQTHYFWGRVSRRAVKYDRSSRPWEDTSEYAELVAKLHEWESNLPHEHMWSPVLLKGYKAGGQDLVSYTESSRVTTYVDHYCRLI